MFNIAHDGDSPAAQGIRTFRLKDSLGTVCSQSRWRPFANANIAPKTLANAWLGYSGAIRAWPMNRQKYPRNFVGKGTNRCSPKDLGGGGRSF